MRWGCILRTREAASKELRVIAQTQPGCDFLLPTSNPQLA